MRHNQTRVPSIGFVSTYPPTACGLATFTAALRGAMASQRGSDEGLEVVGLVESRLGKRRPEVVFEHVNGDHHSLQQAAAVLNGQDLALLQHEYGIYGGPDGVEILDLMARLEIPTIVTLHTVLENPSPGQRKILERIVDGSGQTVVMSETARGRMNDRYDLEIGKVRVVPHGAKAGLAGPSLAGGPRPVVLTWGLIGPGKGLETAIDAFAFIKDLDPLPRYVILGKTHPKVQAAHGDAYLESLMAKVDALGLGDVVEFDSRYLDLDSLIGVIRQADIALLPYESTEQVTSGVLVEAIAAGKPVVATVFPHAVEMLGTGAGALVSHSDPEEMADALRRVLTEPGLAGQMANVAISIGSTLHWPVVANEYETIASSHLGGPAPVAALPMRRADDLAKVG